MEPRHAPSKTLPRMKADHADWNADRYRRGYPATLSALHLQEKPMAHRMFSARICSVLILLAAILTAIAPATLHAQDISGDWQGTLHAGQDLRVIVHIEKNVAEPKDTQKNAAEKNAADKDGKQEAAKVEKKDAGKAEKKDADKKDI